MKEKIYQESFIISVGLLIAGFTVEYVNHGIGVPQIELPYNAIALFLHAFLGIILTFFFSKSQPVLWLTKMPVSIVSMLSFLLVCAIIGTIPQIETENEWINRFRLNQITTSWYFTLIVFWMLTCLLLVGLKRIRTGNLFKNSGFILSHIGLYIALVSGIFGSTDIQRVILEVKENNLNYIAKDEVTKQPIELPFAIYLEEFILEEYLPKISIYDENSDELITNQGKTLVEAKEGATFEVEGQLVEVKKYLPFAIKLGDDYKQVYQYGATPAVLLKVKDKKFWLASGTYNFSAQNYKITKNKTLILTLPEPKKYQSNVKILDKKRNETKVTLLVNEAYNYKGWKIYQLGFDDKKGRWSDKSSFELVRDPWLPFVYCGIFMMIIGAIHMIWIGKRNKN